MYFEFEKLDVYQVTLDFVAVADEVAKSLPKGRAYLRDQLRRAANSVADLDDQIDFSENS